MAGSPRRHISIPIKGDRWRHQTVLGHVSTPVTTPAELQRRRKRRRVEVERPTPARSLIDAHNGRKAATARFPPKITPRHIRTVMRRYEQIMEHACTSLENSCASCGEFCSELFTIDHDRLRSMETMVGVQFQLDNCGISDNTYRFCKGCLNALNGGRVPKFSAMNAVNVTMYVPTVSRGAGRPDLDRGVRHCQKPSNSHHTKIETKRAKQSNCV